MVNKRTAASGLISAVPVPVVDVAADVGLLLELMKKINQKYGLTPEQVEQLDELTKQIIFNVVKQSGKIIIENQIQKLATKATEEALKKMVVSILKKQAGKQTKKTLGKFVPIVGQIATASIGIVSYENSWT